MHTLSTKLALKILKSYKDEIYIPSVESHAPFFTTNISLEPN